MSVCLSPHSHTDLDATLGNDKDGILELCTAVRICNRCTGFVATTTYAPSAKCQRGRLYSLNGWLCWLLVMYTDVANYTLLRSPPATLSSGDLQSPSDHWSPTAFLPTPFGSASVHSVYPPPSARLLSLDPLRHLPAPLPRFSHARVAHPSTRQPAFTVHHAAAQSDLTAPGRSHILAHC